VHRWDGQRYDPLPALGAVHRRCELPGLHVLRPAAPPAAALQTNKPPRLWSIGARSTDAQTRSAPQRAAVAALGPVGSPLQAKGRGARAAPTQARRAVACHRCHAVQSVPRERLRSGRLWPGCARPGPEGGSESRLPATTAGAAVRRATAARVVYRTMRTRCYSGARLGPRLAAADLDIDPILDAAAHASGWPAASRRSGRSLGAATAVKGALVVEVSRL
jgi:hypothetical protein